MSDRRSKDRLEVCLDAVWDGKSGNHTARVTDLSEGGCYVDSLGQAEVGEILNFKLHLPNGEWLDFTGEVAHEKPPLGFGVRFVDLTEAQTEKLHAMLNQSELPKDRVSITLRR